MQARALDRYGSSKAELTQEQLDYIRTIIRQESAIKADDTTIE